MMTLSSTFIGVELYQRVFKSKNWRGFFEWYELRGNNDMEKTRGLTLCM